MGILHDYRTGERIEVETANAKLLSAAEIMGATLVRLSHEGRLKSYLVRDQPEVVQAMFLARAHSLG